MVVGGGGSGTIEESHGRDCWIRYRRLKPDGFFLAVEDGGWDSRLDMRQEEIVRSAVSVVLCSAGWLFFPRRYEQEMRPTALR